MENEKEAVLEKGRETTNQIIEGVMEALLGNDQNFEDTSKGVDCVLFLTTLENGEDENSIQVSNRNATLGSREAIEECLRAAYENRESPVRAAMRKVVMDDLFGGE